MRDLVDADATQPVEQIDVAPRVVADAFADRADGTPRDAHQLGDRALGGVDRQPRGLVFKRAGEARPMPCPRDRADDNAVAATRHARRAGLHERLGASEIQGSPTPPALAEVKARAASAALAAAITLTPGRPDRHDNLILIAD